MSLVKLLYYFFHDLGDNNPINIKIPQKILSVFFADKGYTDIKKRVDGFFSDEIFIQEAMGLMNPETKMSASPKSDDETVSEDTFKEIVTRAKNESLSGSTAETQPVKKQRGRPRKSTKKPETAEDTPDMFISLSGNTTEGRPKSNSKKKLAMDTEFVPKSEQNEQTAAAENEETLRADILLVEPVLNTGDLNSGAINTGALNIEQVPKIEIKSKETASAVQTEHILEAEEIPNEILAANVEELREQEAKLPEENKTKIVISEDIYSDDLIFASQFTDLTPPVQLTDKEKRMRLIDDLFCEASYRRKIIKYIFRKKEPEFTAEVNKILDKPTWEDAVNEIEDMFTRLKVDYFSREAVKFVDVLQGHFIKEDYISSADRNKAV
jgi:hypothetical protein